MISPKSMVVAAILVLIVTVSAWSKLRFVDEEDFAPQRWRLDEHPALRQQEAGQGHRPDPSDPDHPARGHRG